MEDSAGQNKVGIGIEQLDGDVLDTLPHITDEELLGFIGQIPTDITHGEFCAAVELMEKIPESTMKPTTATPSNCQAVAEEGRPSKRRKKQVCHRNTNHADSGKERKAWELLKQWAAERKFEPKYVIKGKSYNSPSRWYEDLFQACEQNPKLPDKLTIGDLHGEAARTGLWLELVYLMRNVANVKEAPGSERLGGWTKSAAALKKHGFNVEVVEGALDHLSFMRMVLACNNRDALQKSAQAKEQLTALTTELKALEEQAGQLQAKITAKREESAKLQEKVDAAKYDNRRLAYWEREAAALEAIMERESDNDVE